MRTHPFNRLTPALLSATVLGVLAMSPAQAQLKPEGNESKLLGRWQIKPTTDTKQAETDLVLEVLANHTFRVHPNCEERKKLKKEAKLEFTEGEWKIDAQDTMQMVIKIRNKPVPNQYHVKFNDDGFTFEAPGNDPERYVAYGGKLPLPCHK